MKKLLYISIMLTFSLNVNANEKKAVEKIEITSRTPCADQWQRDYDQLTIDFCASSELAMELADREFEACLDDMYGE